MSDSDTTIDDLKKLVVKFRDERNRQRHHTQHKLAMSIAIEAAELLEHFQWDEKPRGQQNELAEELADILIYCFFFAELSGIDIATAFRAKLAKTSKKYPPELFGKDGQLSGYYQEKKKHRQGKR